MNIEDVDETAPTHPYVGPAAPWSLFGTLHASLWRVPLRDLPIRLVAGTHAISLGGHALVVTAWANYAPGSTVSYNELMAVVGVRAAGVLAPAGTVGPIWVDNDMAAAGGLALWRIPKLMGRFDAALAHPAGQDDAGIFSQSLTVQGRHIASLRFEPRWSLPLPTRITVWTIQEGVAGPVRTRCTLGGRWRHGYAHWRFAEDGPLGFLHGRTPLGSACLENLTGYFGV